MIRLILAALFVFIFLVVSLPIQLVLYLIGKKRPDIKANTSRAIVQWAFRVVRFIAGVRLTVLGQENLPTDQAVLYVGNHRSIFDIVLTYPLLLQNTGYVAKNSLEKVPSLRIWMRYIGCLFLDRSNLKEGMKMILKAIESVKNGTSIFIFPEGTRNKGEDELQLMEFHEGSLKIAVKSGCPIIPVSINNSVNIFEGHIPWIRSVPVIIEFGTPLDPASFSKDEKKHLGEITRDIITETLKKNQELLESA